jgi:hypothetical protein
MGVKLFRNNIYKGIKAENPIFLHLVGYLLGFRRKPLGFSRILAE